MVTSEQQYTQRVGDQLRRIRMERGLSLQDVERRSEGEWKAAVVGSYERGDRNISAARLCELAEFYGVPVSDILPTGQEAPVVASSTQGIMLDLSRLSALGPRWRGLRRYCESIQAQRGDYNGRVLSVRAEDLRALAVILDADEEELLATLRDAGVLRDQ